MVRGRHTACLPLYSRPPSMLSEKSIELGACTAPRADILASWDKSSPWGCPCRNASLAAAENKALFSKCPGVRHQKPKHGHGEGRGGEEQSRLFSRNPRAQMAKGAWEGPEWRGEMGLKSRAATASSPPLMRVEFGFQDVHIPQRPGVWEFKGGKSPERMRGAQEDRVSQEERVQYAQPTHS